MRKTLTIIGGEDGVRRDLLDVAEFLARRRGTSAVAELVGMAIYGQTFVGTLKSGEYRKWKLKNRRSKRSTNSRSG